MLGAVGGTVSLNSIERRRGVSKDQLEEMMPGCLNWAILKIHPNTIPKSG